ncbi:MAG: hypothetical protein E6L03_09000 [Thaumarchaeota archaeon]|nr:MAG: hypothetical protein E6L03_09000 [Nitrososphaerota archaeon]
MTTEEELKALQDEYDSLNIDYNRYQKAVEIQAKLQELRKIQKRTVLTDTSLGGQMRFVLEKNGLRTTFYCFIFGMVIFLIGAITPYYTVKDIPFALAFFNLVPVLLIGFGIYSIPFIKEFLNEVKPKVENK